MASVGQSGPSGMDVIKAIWSSGHAGRAGIVTGIVTPIAAVSGIIGASVEGAKNHKDKVEMRKKDEQIATMQAQINGMQSRSAGGPYGSYM